jgi:HPt (histidine-containing phosphotransfer) domain-containing protein
MMHRFRPGNRELRRLPVENTANIGGYVKRSLNHLCVWLGLDPVRSTTGNRNPSHSMPLHAQRIEWMPSPPLAPDDGPIDLQHLARMTLGDAALERQVLGLFASQATNLIAKLAALPAEAETLAHTLNGSARAIGALRVAQCAEALEAAIRQGANPAKCQIELKAAVADARAAIDALLQGS